MNAENLVDFTLELSEREIYNDIRAECDIVDILTLRPDATPEFFDSFQVQFEAPGGCDFMYYSEPGTTLHIPSRRIPDDHHEVQWRDITEVYWTIVSPLPTTQSSCEAAGGTWMLPWGDPNLAYCSLPSEPIRGQLSWYIRETRSRDVIVTFINNSSYRLRVLGYVGYWALTSGKRYIKLRSHNATSEALYGRRVMDLVWPLGQHPTQMQAILDRYCDKHNMVQTVPGYGYEYGYEDESEEPEPICTARATIAGKTDELAEELLRYRIASFGSERGECFAIPLIHPALGLTELSQERWYVNSINISDDVEGILEGTFGLEQQRAMERTSIFQLQSDPPDPDIYSRLFDAAPDENHVLA